MKGTFYVDTSHGPWSWTITHPSYDGWLELHPIDWMVRLESPPPHRRKTTALIEVAHDEVSTTSRSGSITPDFDVPGKELRVHTCRDLIDGRFTFSDTVVRHDVRSVDEQGQPLDRVNYDIEVRGSPGRPGRFKAAYIVTWQGQQTSNAAFVSQSVPSPMGVAQQHEVSVTMKNTGPTTWMSGGANPFHLASANSQVESFWGIGRVDVPAEVAPGDEVIFPFTVVAPPDRGYYNFQWRMMQESVEWFGDFTPDVEVRVDPPGGPTTEVPFVRELGITAAVDAILAADLEPRFTGDSGADAWVADQSPEGGAVVLRGSTVTCRLRTGLIP
jgi:Ig-like domain from next to BRCA1 gene